MKNLGSAARLASAGDASWLRAPALSLAPDLTHGVTHASLGNFSLSAGDNTEKVRERRRSLLAAAGLGHCRVAAPGLTHSACAAVFDDGALPDGKYDAIVTADPRSALAVTVADCVPVFFADVEDGGYGVAHAGWRGLAGGIVRQTIELLRGALGAKLGNVLVATGPAIRGPSYEVGADVAGSFPEEFATPSGDAKGGRFQLDLPSCVLAEARAAGIPAENLVDFSLDTYTHSELLFSHRRGDRARHWAFIGRP